MPAKADEIMSLDKEKLNKHHTNFQTIEGKKSWETLPIDLQLSFLSRFIKENISIDSLIIDWKKLEDKDFAAYHETIWKVHFTHDKPSLLESTENIRKIFIQKCFDLDLPPPINPPEGFYKHISGTPNDKCSKNQTIWYHNTFLENSDKPDTIAFMYANRNPGGFYERALSDLTIRVQIIGELCFKHDIPPKNCPIGDSIRIYYSFSLPIPKNGDAIKELTQSQLEWYAIFLVGRVEEKLWLQFPLEVQHVLSQRLKANHPEIVFPLMPKSNKEIENASIEIIQNIYNSPLKHWLYLTREMQKNCNARFITEGLGKRKIHSESSNEIEQLSAEELSGYHEVFRFFAEKEDKTIDPFFDQFTDEIINAFCNKFIVLKMEPPSLKFNKYPIPNSIGQIAKLENYQYAWMDNYFKVNPYAFGKLDFALQVEYYERKVQIGRQLSGHQAIFLTPHSKEEINKATEKIVRAVFSHFRSRPDDWSNLSLEMQKACNARFVEVGDCLLQIPQTGWIEWFESWWG